jgi:hypothetical protein
VEESASSMRIPPAAGMMRREADLAHAPARPDPDRDCRLRWAQRDDGPVEAIRPGDVVWIAPG